jgi:hypothetical protein
MVAGISGVHTGPGATALTRMPRSARFVASALVNATMPALVVAVVQQLRGRLRGLDGRGVDDACAGRHVCGRGLAQPEHGVEVRLEHPVELLGGDAENAVRLRHLVGGVVHQHVDAAELVHRTLDYPHAVLLAADVTGDQHGLAPGLAHQFRRLLGISLFFVQIGQKEVGALAGEGDRDRPADAGVAPGDHRRAAGQPARTAVGPLAVVRFRSHPLATAGMVLLLAGQLVRSRVLRPRILLRVLVVRHAGNSLDRRP